MIKKYIRFTESVNSENITIITQSEYESIFKASARSAKSKLFRPLFDIVKQSFENAGVPPGLKYIPSGKLMIFTYNHTITGYIFSDDDYYLYVKLESLQQYYDEYLTTYAQIDVSESLEFLSKFLDTELQTIIVNI